MSRRVPVLPFLSSLLVTALAAAAVAIIIENLAVSAILPRYERATTDFSSAYLQRVLQVSAGRPGEIIILGDSVLWGYRMDPSKTAIGLLKTGGCACRNLAFKSGSPANYYALVRLFGKYGLRPGMVVLEINQRVFNPGDGSYRQLHPAIAELATPLLAPTDRSTLGLNRAPEMKGSQQLDTLLSRFSMFYAMRSDIREHLYGDVDSSPAPPERMDSARFEGTYDLTPLTAENVEVQYLIKTLHILRTSRIPVLALLTPANHSLLHEYIDSPEYRANNAYLKDLLRHQGSRILDLDTKFSATDFIDNDHLTEKGNRRLADLLRSQLAR